MLDKIKDLINMYNEKMIKILEDTGGEFNYEKDYDDQITTAEEESEYNTLNYVIADLSKIIKE